MAPGLSASPPVVLLLLSLLGLAAAGKLLVVPVDGSHWLSMRELLDMLQQKGHEVVVVAPEVSLHIKPSKTFAMKMYPVPFTQEELDSVFKGSIMDLFKEGSFLDRVIRQYQQAKKTSALFLATCSHLIHNKELIRYLEESKFDAILTDPILPCGAILAEYLSLPSVYFLKQVPCGLEYQATQCPNPPSYVPRVFTDLTDHMTFLQRVKNMLYDIPNFFICDVVFQPYAELASELLKREVTVPDLLRQASIWLMKLDFVLHFPKPLMPNMVLISGVNCAYKKLSQVGPALFSLAVPAGFGNLGEAETQLSLERRISNQSCFAGRCWFWYLGRAIRVERWRKC
ncbi:UDP-glucuronosyltransferase 1A1-like [Motacilla alba alba]|uniref:UDP-glucuronosyltransferase 1A1-like n=1 Tax=Motacilla alba alba TaxID=1094192 RepID=UPI0018D5A2FC|nr:UDP-glucuronosyltransferase 1A1-like [Motacilla alba alba]